MSDDTRISPAQRTVEALLALRNGPKSLGKISEETGLPKPTAHRLLGQLVDANVVYQLADQEYMLGVRAIELGQALLNAPAWEHAFVARPELKEFARTTGETVTLHVRMGNYRMCIAEFESVHALRYVGGVGLTAPLYLGSAGKVLLAFASERDRERYLTALERAAAHVGPTDHALDISALRRTLHEVRTAGWAESTGERIEGASAVSVPVRGDDGSLVASLSVLGPTLRLGEEQRQKLVPELQRIAAQMASTGKLQDALPDESEDVGT